MKQLDTVIIGGGQAGLTMSFHLTQSGREHLVLEKDQMANSWREERWDSFTLVTPNRQMKLPGMEYEGENPDGFFTREEVVEYIDDFVESFDPPVEKGVEATAVEPAADGDGIVVRTDNGDYRASNVVVATGTFQEPRIPDFAKRLDGEITQLHSSEYRNPDQLPSGGVLVVGSGQSGCQIAEELHEAGREVHLSTGKAPRVPRRYRGDDFTRWFVRMGIADRTVDQLESPAERFDPNPHLSGKNGGHTINLHLLYRDGIQLLGRTTGARGTVVEFDPDLQENLAAADRFAREFKKGVDKFIEKQDLEAPEEDEPEPQDGYEAPTFTELDLKDARIRTVVWATGYEFDFSWVDFPVFDEFGYPIQEQGVTDQPGLYFLGLHWLHTIKSGLFLGVNQDALNVAAHIV